MNNIEFYEELLGLESPWKVEDIKLSMSEERVDINVVWPKETKGNCPECGRLCKLHDRRDDRIWRHLDTCQIKTYLHCKLPRVKCPTHGVRTLKVPWAEPKSRFTLQFEKLAILLLQSSENRSKTAEILRISWDELNHIMEKAVSRGLSRRSDEPIKYIGMDEKSFLRGHRYATVMSDIEGRRVLDVAEDRTGEAVDRLWSGLSVTQKSGVAAVSMDFWRAFVNGAEKHVPQAEIVHDKFHIMKYMNEAVDKVRREEHKKLLNQDDTRLKGTKYLWLKSRNKFTTSNKRMFKILSRDQLAVGRAWNRKELLRHLWDYTYEKPARNYFKKWYYSATHSRLKPVIDVAKMLKRHFENIITYVKHRITNSFSEGINSKIQHIKSTARGFRNFRNYRISILFYCGDLEMNP